MAQIRNVLDKVRKSDQEAVKRALGAISHTKSRQKATQAFWAFARRYRAIYPKAVACVEADLDDLWLSSITPRRTRSKLRTNIAISELSRSSG